MNGEQIKALQLGQEYIKLKQKKSFPTITTPNHPSPTSSVTAIDPTLPIVTTDYTPTFSSTALAYVAFDISIVKLGVAPH